MRADITELMPTEFSANQSNALHIGMLSTMPPTLCGLATFSAALTKALEEAGNTVECVRVEETPETHYSGTQTLIPGSSQSRAAVARQLNLCDVAIIQHEFGIYGGPDGQEILELIAAVHVPMVIVMHTVPAHPSANQLRILKSLARLASSIVVLSEAARQQLISLIGRQANLSMIPHGAATRGPDERRTRDVRHDIDLLTWGLIGPGKGIEGAITALGLARGLGVELHYTIAGVTHPKVARRDGDAYVASLRELAQAHHVEDLVEFDHVYRGVHAMLPFIESAAVVVLPYESREQVTSGVLVDSLAAGRPVIATAFPHALELLGNGSGRVVEHGNPGQMAAAMIETRNPETLAVMARQAMQLAPEFSWRAVADRYLKICTSVTVGQRLAI